MDDPWIKRSVVFTLEFIVVALLFALGVGLFNDKVDNKEIFEILKPNISTIVGAFVVILSNGLSGKPK